MSKGASDFGHKPAGKTKYKFCKRCKGTGSVCCADTDDAIGQFDRIVCPECDGWGYTHADFKGDK